MKNWRPVPAADLPDGLILFDGVCVLCSAWVKFVIPRDPKELFRFVAIQSELGRALATRFNIDADMPESNVVIRAGVAWFKGDSALRVCHDLPGWRWTRMFRLAPRPLRNVFYDIIARNRYRLFGRRDTCFMPSPDLQRRFVSTLDEIA